MSTYLIALFFASASFVVCSNTPVDSVSLQEFQNWQCTRLCDAEGNEAKVKEICVQYQDTNLPDAYDTDKIRSESGCKNAFVALTIDDQEKAQLAHVGLCYLSKHVTKCITAAPDKNDLLMWSHEKAKLRGHENPMRACRPESILSGMYPQEPDDSSS